MSVVDDILYAPVGSTSKRADWTRVPVHINLIAPHLLDGTTRWANTPPWGIHYAITHFDDPDKLRDLIHAVLADNFDQSPPMVPAGVLRARLPIQPDARAEHYNSDDIIVLDGLGINPIIAPNGPGGNFYTLWGSNFIDIAGEVHRLVEPFCGNNTIHPAIFKLAQPNNP